MHASDPGKKSCHQIKPQGFQQEHLQYLDECRGQSRPLGADQEKRRLIECSQSFSFCSNCIWQVIFDNNSVWYHTAVNDVKRV